MVKWEYIYIYTYIGVKIDEKRRNEAEVFVNEWKVFVMVGRRKIKLIVHKIDIVHRSMN